MASKQEHERVCVSCVRILVYRHGEGTDLSFFFFNDTATTEIYTLSLHDALPIFPRATAEPHDACRRECPPAARIPNRSEEHTSELQSRLHLVCRLLLEKKKDQHFAS